VLSQPLDPPLVVEGPMRPEWQPLARVYNIEDSSEPSVLRRLVSRALDLEVPTDDSEDSWHQVWDSVITNVFMLLSSHCDTKLRYTRNKADSGQSPFALTEKSKRPDLLLYLDAHLVLKGEEKGSKSLEIPRQELLAKMLCWNPVIMGDMRYLLAYATAGRHVKFYAITPSLTTVEISRTFDLFTGLGRLQTITTVVNLYKVIVSMIPQLPDNPPELYTASKPRGSLQAVITVQNDHVTKRVVADLSQRTAILELHRRIQGCPHSIKLLQRREPEFDEATQSLMLYLQPLGREIMPRNVLELKAALKNVLTVLQWLHSRGLVHRDIRWPNVLFGDMGWFVIDYERAATVDSAIDWAPDGMPPEIVQGSSQWTFAMDVFLAGKLLFHRSHLLCPEGIALMTSMTSDQPDCRPTAEEALKVAWLHFD
jgi:hypothetical protein